MKNENLYKLICLINKVIELIKLPRTNTLWSGWDTPSEAIHEFTQLLEKLENNDKTAIAELKIIFAPTGSLQDLAISSGWSDKYADLASEFDQLYKNLIVECVCN